MDSENLELQFITLFLYYFISFLLSFVVSFFLVRYNCIISKTERAL